jgi:hypothetical protein
MSEPSQIELNKMRKTMEEVDGFDGKKSIRVTYYPEDKFVEVNGVNKPICYARFWPFPLNDEQFEEYLEYEHQKGLRTCEHDFIVKRKDEQVWVCSWCDKRIPIFLNVDEAKE